MDIISFNEAATCDGRIKKFIENPDSTSGIVTVPKVIASGETITIPAGRVAVLPNVQIDGVLNVEGEVFIPSGSTLSTVVEKVTSTDKAIVRFDGTTGAVQNSSVIIADSGNVGIGTSSPISKLHIVSNVDGEAFRVQRAGGTNLTLLRVNINESSNTATIEATAAAGSPSLNFATAGYEKLRIDSAGNVLAVSPTGGLGYGPGAGGTVTQLTSKNTAVTLNKPTGRIIMNNAALAAGATSYFMFNNSCISVTDNILLESVAATYVSVGAYTIGVEAVGFGIAYITVKNNTAVSLSEAIQLNFAIIKGANS